MKHKWTYQKLWKRENRWILRCRIYGWFKFPCYVLGLIQSILEGISEIYNKFLCWLFWNVLDFMFRTEKGKKHKNVAEYLEKEVYKNDRLNVRPSQKVLER